MRVPRRSRETTKGISLRVLRSLIWRALIVGLAMLAARGAQAESSLAISRGVDFLIAQQSAEGRWQSTEVRSTQATTEALRALSLRGAAPAARAGAADFLIAEPIEDSDDSSRRILALSAEGHAGYAVQAVALANALALAADGDGGWGLAARFERDPLDSALSLAAFSAQPVLSIEAYSRSLLALLSFQNVDGGWPCTTVADGSADSEIYCTALALEALASAGGRFYVVPQIESGAGFLHGRRNGDGSFGPLGAAQIVRTATAALGLAAVGKLGGEALAIESFLVAAQRADGSWEGDPYTTALGVRALDALAAVPICGDGVSEAGEACDLFDLRGRACDSFGLGGGTLVCSPTCGFDTSACTAAASCGDGVINRAEEQCDGADFGGRTCESLGLGGGTLACTGGCRLRTGECASTGIVDPPTLAFDSSSPFCAGSPQTVSVGLTTPTDIAVEKVDVFYLLGRVNFSSGAPNVAGNLTDTLDRSITKIQEILPGVSVGFGVGHADSFGGAQPTFSFGVSTLRPFTLVQPIITPDVPNFFALISSATARPRSPTSVVPTFHEALYQIATGEGFDGDGNGSRLDSGPAGALSTITTPGVSGDIPPFSSNVAPSSGTLGGVGFRAGALPIVIVFNDWCSAAAYTANEPIPTSFVGVGGNLVSSRPFSCVDDTTFGERRRFGFVSDALTITANTVSQAVAPRGAATVPQALSAVLDRGITLLGLIWPAFTIEPNPSLGRNNPALFSAAITKLTGTLDTNGIPRVSMFRFGNDLGATMLRDAVRQVVDTAGGLARPRDVGLAAEAVPEGVSASIAPALRTGVLPGQQARFDVAFSGDGQPRQGAMTLRFRDATTGLTLGTIPVSIDCRRVPTPPVDADGDGDPEGVDCDDLDPSVHLGAPEILGNGKNDDCDASTPDQIPATAALCSMFADRPSYAPTEVAVVTSQIRNLTPSMTLAGLVATLEVRPATGGAAVASISRTLPSILPEGIEQAVDSVPLAGLAAGPYLAELSVAADVASGDRVALCAREFVVESTETTGAGISATLALAPASQFVGLPSLATAVVHHQGNAPISALPLEVAIVDPDSGSVLRRFAVTVALASGATEAVSLSLATAGLAAKTYLVLLTARFAGAEAETLANATLDLVALPNEAPNCAAARPSQSQLWPPNHRWVPIAIEGLSDPDGDPLSVAVLSIRQDEPTDAKSHGSTCPDGRGVGTAVAEVRSERRGGGDGRVYHVRFRALDDQGASCDGEVTVCVRASNGGPHSVCVDQGPVFDSTACQ